MADQAVTLATATSASNGKRIGTLSAEEARQTGFTHRWTIPFDVVNTSTWTTQGDTVTVTLGTTPAKYLIDRVAVNVETAFDTTGTLTMEVGTSGDTDNYLDAQTVKTAATLLADPGATVKTKAGSIGTAAATLVARFNTQAANGAPSDITAGKVHIFLRIIDLDSLI
jgi:hypothetical protein